MTEQGLRKMIADKLAIGQRSIDNTIHLLKEGATIPFIARYRKEATQSLDETQISAIQSEWDALNELIKRKEYILATIEEQGQLSPALKSKIENCWSASKLEDYYLPFKKKRNTRAEKARKAGLEPLANMIWQQQERQLYQKATSFLSSEVKSTEEALQGARDILAEAINEDSHCRDLLRKMYASYGQFESQVIKKKEKEAIKYKDYFDYQELARKAPSHRILAILRGEKDGFLRCKLSIDTDQAEFKIKKYLIKHNADRQCAKQLSLSIEDGLKRLLLPSLETEFKNHFKAKADDEAIQVFTENLKQLLLAAPLGSRRVIGIDPGFRTGCKLVCLDENGDLEYNTSIFPHPPQAKWQESQSILSKLVKDFKIDAIAIGNGTAGKESYALAKSIDFERSVDVFLINEDGASIYSSSEIARAEFPDLDLTVRGAISIGRRLLDPLSELVKIDPKSIGVGQYQHDVNQSKLKSSLNQCVEFCVNAIGVDLNTASEYLLQHISGLGPVLASNIIAYRKDNGSFKDICSLKEVARMGEKAFEQCAGFLRVRNGKNLLDNTGVHPERYKLVMQMAKDLNVAVEQLISNDALLRQINLNNYIGGDIGLPTLKDIIKELSKPGFDIRGKAEVFEFTPGIQSIDDLRPGMYVKGIINNITKFGAFVDIGIKEAGLIHVSQMADRYVSDPMDVVQINQKVNAKIIELDPVRKRISLSLKE